MESVYFNFALYGSKYQSTQTDTVLFRQYNFSEGPVSLLATHLGSTLPLGVHSPLLLLKYSSTTFYIRLSNHSCSKHDKNTLSVRLSSVIILDILKNLLLLYITATNNIYMVVPLKEKIFFFYANSSPFKKNYLPIHHLTLL